MGAIRNSYILKENPKERDHLEDFSVDGKIIAMDLKYTGWM
jgi:hypothetical protein